MRDAVIVEAVRTPIGKRNGSLASWHSADLSAQVLSALTDRTGIAPEQVDDVIWGCVRQSGHQANNVGRNAVLAAGWPESVPATTIDRQCGSSQQSVHFAAAGLIAGQYDVAVAGGVEIMSSIPAGAAIANPDLGHPTSVSIRHRYGVDFNQGVGAEKIAEKWGISRSQLDEFSARSHERLAAAIDSGALKRQIVPVAGAEGQLVDTDEGLRRGTTVDKLANLKPAFVEGGQIHAGNSSQISDGASALLMMTSEKAAELGLEPIARVHTATVAGDDPVLMLTALIPATVKALQRSGLSIDDIGAFEVNEAFASVPLAWISEMGADPERVNPNGGAIAIGHPLGASGARLMTTLVHHMRDQNIRYGLQTMCEGGGLGNATILELL
ncbi:thiolase family protein [Rhodococcus sp. T2V]|uniref:thiolase family protein n=1 Tax=Rhodococcus sp. T2V TaxID=3034164 RepID=UPI0023E0B9AF|nr:thiolase family protein [Rhodococcus sp. T2V]MDF3310062.1 thiolase family protein [Rhodococcus sp. T2V]